MDAALEAADALGFEAVTLAAVAEKLGIRLPSLYNYFDGLAGLRRLLKVWAMGEMVSQMRIAAVGVAGADALIAVAHAYRAFAHAHPGIYPAILRVYPNDPEVDAIARDMLGLFETILKPYGFENQTMMYQSIRVFRSMIHGFVDLERQGGFGMPLDLDETFQHLMATYIAGLKTL
jgi:AcrR family transcriptional regulator